MIRPRKRVRYFRSHRQTEPAARRGTWPIRRVATGEERKGGGLAKSWSKRLRIRGKQSNVASGAIPSLRSRSAHEDVAECFEAVD